ncbi:MAG: peptide chain release factor N(5)-glutamine methyltransferase [Myxococcales bacterium]|nr:peptide chain release factor N(5)-glutamine methyltransferase [Myxococcales bacterium]
MAEKKCSDNRYSFSLRKLKYFASGLLSDLGIETAQLDVRILLEHVLGYDHQESFFYPERMMTSEQETQFLKLLKRRMCFEPIAYIIESKEFFGYDFKVNSRCLIPRPDTECVVEQCLSRLKSGDRVYDICTGSGVIAITLLRECPQITAVASDLSQQALDIASINAHKLGVADRIDMRCGDLFAPFGPMEQAQLVVANPPYIGQEDYENLSATVRKFEPEMALKAGDEEGIVFYRRLLSDALRHLVSSGYLVLEIGFNQAHLIKSLVSEYWRDCQVIKDLAGNDRVIVLQKK